MTPAEITAATFGGAITAYWVISGLVERWWNKHRPSEHQRWLNARNVTGRSS